MDERTGVSVEVDRLFRVEGHVLAGIYFQDEIFQGTQTYDACDVVCLFLSQSVQFTQFVAGFLGCFNHGLHQVVGVYYCTFTALHLTFRQFHHTIREVYEVFTPFEAQLVEQDRQYLEVVVLFVTYHINHLVDRIILEAQLGSTDVLCHVYRSTVTTEQQFVVQTFRSQVGPYRTVFLAIEQSFFQTFHYFFLSFKVSL